MFCLLDFSTYQTLYTLESVPCFLHPLKWNILYSNHSDGSQSIPALFYLKLNFLAWRVACCWENGFRCFSELFTSAVWKTKPAQCFDLLSLVLPFFFLIQNLFIGMVSRSSWYRVLLVLLPSERASFRKPCFSSCRLAEDSRAANTQNYCLCMAQDSGDFIASWAFYIHEIRIGALHQALLLMFPLLLFWRGMKKILCERHVLVKRSSPPEKPLYCL